MLLALTATAVLAALLVAPAAGASSPSTFPSAARLAQALRLSVAPNGAGFDPRLVYGGEIVQLATKWIPIVRDGVTYKMNVDVWESDPSSGGTPLIDVTLYRPYRPHGTVLAYQIHEYTFLSANRIQYDRKNLSSASFDAGTDMGLSSLSVRYRSSAPATTYQCHVHGGGTGTHEETVGTVDLPVLSIDTGTKPFFGTITERPTAARLIYDPGCPIPKKYRGDCPGAEVIAPSDINGNYADAVAAGPQSPATVEEGSVFDYPANGGQPEFVEHLSWAIVPDGDLPPPTWDQNGATATMSTKGNRLMSGAVTFTSAAPPRIKHGLICREHGVRYTRTEVFFKGAFETDPPLVLRYDTGDVTLPPPLSGYLAIEEYR
jgi:hypothetical protein